MIDAGQDHPRRSIEKSKHRHVCCRVGRFQTGTISFLGDGDDEMDDCCCCLGPVSDDQRRRGWPQMWMLPPCPRQVLQACEGEVLQAKMSESEVLQEQVR